MQKVNEIFGFLSPKQLTTLDNKTLREKASTLRNLYRDDLDKDELSVEIESFKYTVDSSISDYVADLRRDISECEFSVACECSKNVSVADIFLRAQFIRGIKDSWIKEQILQSELTDFNDIVDKAIALETSKINCRELSKSNTTALEQQNRKA
ncbi:hypothetical protein AVEN_262305-1 [Araneus ventricosus]|uniref:Retrotransposon gag domain-containing protein n=1 Tax=Araneus ventricosus TaxID=182803 RepID=A0A4Y2RAY5_ARAVE|nr:hypothetical protein AVEN_262305-1 [Araneus ventricosus]